MLNLPSTQETEATAARPQSPRHSLRRPLSGGDRLRGWADVREIHANPQDDGACVPKYHVDLNLTAHLDWEEWQRLCAAESTQTDAPTLCMLSSTAAPNSTSDAETDSEQDHAAERRNTSERHACAPQAASPAS